MLMEYFYREYGWTRSQIAQMKEFFDLLEVLKENIINFLLVAWNGWNNFSFFNYFFEDSWIVFIITLIKIFLGI